MAIGTLPRPVPCRCHVAARAVVKFVGVNKINVPPGGSTVACDALVAIVLRGRGRVTIFAI